MDVLAAVAGSAQYRYHADAIGKTIGRSWRWDEGWLAWGACVCQLQDISWLRVEELRYVAPLRAESVQDCGSCRDGESRQCACRNANRPFPKTGGTLRKFVREGERGVFYWSYGRKLAV